MAREFNKPLVCPVMIGRGQDLTTLRLLVNRASSGQGQVALVCGEAGGSPPLQVIKKWEPGTYFRLIPPFSEEEPYKKFT